MGIELLLQLLICPIDTELLERVLLEVLKTVLKGQWSRLAARLTYNIKDTDELGSLFSSSPTLATQTLVDHSHEPLRHQPWSATLGEDSRQRDTSKRIWLPSLGQPKLEPKTKPLSPCPFRLSTAS
jgi:hypothetical protein